jgi:hypothetical protein
MVLEDKGEVKQRRKRKAKVVVDDADTQPNIQLIIEEEVSNVEQHQEPDAVVHSATVPTSNVLVSDTKKRGRKPKGGKIVVRSMDVSEKPPALTNVILHLKCSLKDLDAYNQEQSRMMKDPMSYIADVPPSIMTYDSNDTKSAFASYINDNNNTSGDQIQQNNSTFAYADSIPLSKTSTTILTSTSTSDDKKIYSNQIPDMQSSSNGPVIVDNGFTPCKDDPSVQLKDVQMKLKKLKISLYKNALHEKKSACFWCTYDFDNQACYIPKYEMDGTICAYGSFCRPECAVAFLMKDNIDDSTKFERYHLLNQLYGKIYQFKDNIKPAPNPYYLLDKYYGNLSIQEYRKLLNTEHMLLVIDKPLTRILPELHEDTDDFIVGIYGGNKGSSTQAGGVYKVKRQSEKQQGPSKASIIRGKFGLTQ